MTRGICFGLLLAAMMLGSATQASAERIVFVNGRAMSVKSYRIDGDVMIVTLRGGGEATFNTSIVADIAADEVPDELEVASPPAPSVYASTSQPADARPFAHLISTVALRHGIPPALVHAVVQAESNYQPRARSQVGARGLMQVMPSTALEFGAGNLYDPHANLEVGVQYLKSLLARFSLSDALAAYNAGPSAVRKYGGMPPFPETQDYVRKVLANFHQ